MLNFDSPESDNLVFA